VLQRISGLIDDDCTANVLLIAECASIKIWKSSNIYILQHRDIFKLRHLRSFEIRFDSIRIGRSDSKVMPAHCSL